MNSVILLRKEFEQQIVKDLWIYEYILKSSRLVQEEYQMYMLFCIFTPQSNIQVSLPKEKK